MKLIGERSLDSHEAQSLTHLGFILKLISMGAVKDRYQVYVSL